MKPVSMPVLMMIANFDQDGDGALNTVELQAGLIALFQRMSAFSGGGQTEPGQVGAQRPPRPDALGQRFDGRPPGGGRGRGR